MYDGDAEDRVARRENLQQLAAAVAEAAARGQGLEEFLDAVALLEETDDETAADAVSLMTLHSAKGLEFDIVFLSGLEDGLLPHANSRDDLEGLEEERRLAYVGMTRARRPLALTGARTRFLFGQRQPTRPSRFLDDLPDGTVEDVSQTSPAGWAPGSQGVVSRTHAAAAGRSHRGAGRRSSPPRRRRRHRLAAGRPGPPPPLRHRCRARLPGPRRAAQAGGLLRPGRPQDAGADHRQARKGVKRTVRSIV